MQFGWNGPIGKLFWTDMRAGFLGAMPYMVAALGITEEDYVRLLDEAGKDGVENFLFVNFRAVTARVPVK
ncbi:hypothetical protein HK405_001964, partial [Cladochytrium tenue]